MIEAEDILARATASGGGERIGGGGRPAFTSAEVGYFLAGLKRGSEEFEPLPEGAVRILLLRYADGNEQDAVVLLRELLNDAPGSGQTYWYKSAAQAAVCRAAMAEFLQAKRCATCEGRQTVMAVAQVRACPDCAGTGYRPASAATRATALGIPHGTFAGGPAERYYQERMRCLIEWEAIGIRRVRGKARSR